SGPVFNFPDLPRLQANPDRPSSFVLKRTLYPPRRIQLGIRVAPMRPGSSPAKSRLRTIGTCFASKISLGRDSHMRFKVKFCKFLLLFVLSLFLLPVLAHAQHYKQTNLVSNLASIS